MIHLNNTILFKPIIKLVIFIQFFTFAYGQVMITNVEECCHNKVVVEETKSCCTYNDNAHLSLKKSCCSETENTTSVKDHNCNDYFNLINLKQNCGCDHQFIDLNTVLLNLKTNKLSVETDFIHLQSEKTNNFYENHLFNIIIESKPFHLISRDICILKSSFLI